MIANSLIPYSSALFNPVTSWTGAEQPDLKLSYPAWMTDNAARGIGNNFTPDYAAPVASTSPSSPYAAAAASPVLGAAQDVAPPVVPVAGDHGLNGTGEPGNAPGAEATGSFIGDVKGMYNGLSDLIKGGSDTNPSAGPSIEPGSQGDTGYGGAGDHAEVAPNFQGGILTRNKLIGPDPSGPDDGFASVQTGEGVLTRKALKHYGPGIVERLNKLMVDKAALR